MVIINHTINDYNESATSSLSSLSDTIMHSSAGNPNIGQLRTGLVDTVDVRSGKVKLYIISDQMKDMIVDYPGFMSAPDGSSGLWYGLKQGDVVLCGIGYGNKYTILNKIGETGFSGDLSDAATQQLIFGQTDTSIAQMIFQDLTPGAFLFKSGNSNIKVSGDNGVFVGNLGQGSINFDTHEDLGASSNFTSVVSEQYYNINDAGFSINGIILRDKTSDTTGDASQYNDPRVYNQWYKDLKPLGFDTSLIITEQTKGSVIRNPALIEQRHVVYEFSDEFFIESDEKEARKQTDVTGKGASTQINEPLSSRRIRKEDCFSLSLVSPNYLIETIAGTGLDINGNVLDLNRNVLPVGNTTLGTTIADGGFAKLREVYRRSLAYHFELNARKDPTTMSVESGSGNEYDLAVLYNSVDPFKRDRSRFFFDVDKEGQFKLNVPYSSEVGNVGVLARYENYTTINPYKKDDQSEFNYDYFIKKDEANKDILLEQLGLGFVSLAGKDELLAKDRITSNTLKVGTMFHDISKTCVYPVELKDDGTIKPQTDSDNQFRSGVLYGPDYYTLDADRTQRNILRNTDIDSIITKELRIDKNGSLSPNAGGRSGTAVFDGMLNVSIGANTADRQSLWLDLQGGLVQRIGCDKNGISSATQTDGDFYLQIGGDPGFRATDGSISNKDPDPRFDPILVGNSSVVTPSSNKTNILEIRIIQGNGQYSRILIDGAGMLLASSSNIELRSDSSIILTAAQDIRINAEEIKFHADDIINDLETPVHRQSRTYEKVYEPDPGGGYMIPKPFPGANPIIGG